MKILLEQTELRSFSLLHLLGWIESVGDLLSDEEECPFDTVEELGMQLEKWHQEFKKHSGNASIAQEVIQISCYGEDVILISKPGTGEHLILTITFEPQLHGQY